MAAGTRMRAGRGRAPGARTSTVRVDGHRVGLTVQGEGPPLVLLHGLGRDRSDWDAVLPELARTFTAWAIDIEGFGRSEPWTRTVSLASMAQMVRRTLLAAGEVRPVRLVGNSMGGAVALRMTADDPGSVAGLVLLSPAGFGRDAAPGLRLLTLPVLGDAFLALDASPAALHLRSRRIDQEAKRLETASALRLRRRRMRRHYLQVVHDLGGWGGIHEGWRTEVLTALAAAAVPTLIVWGDQDAVLPYSHLASVQQTLPHATAVPLPGVGHMPQVERPEETARMIAEFFAAPRD